jgi:pimeloyl-ACP methyl ester carboxylesterase
LWYLKKDLKKLRADFSKVTCPVLLFHGDKDGLVPIANLQYAQKMLSNAASVTTTVFRGANHFIVWTRFEEIKNALLSLADN